MSMTTAEHSDAANARRIAGDGGVASTACMASAQSRHSETVRLFAALTFRRRYGAGVEVHYPKP